MWKPEHFYHLNFSTIILYLKKKKKRKKFYRFAKLLHVLTIIIIHYALHNFFLTETFGDEWLYMQKINKRIKFSLAIFQSNMSIN